MSKKGGSKKQLQTATSHSPVSLRQETTGRIQTKSTAIRNPKSFLKLEHLQNLAVWANEEALIPSMGAFFGRRFAAAGEALGIQPDFSLIQCQRCESILQPGSNCTVRIEGKRAKAMRRRHKKPNNTSMQNSVVYKCHFCSHRNLKRGTPKGYVKEICPSPSKQKPAASARSKPSKEDPIVSLDKITGSKDEAVPGDTFITNSPATPIVSSGTTLLDAKRKKRNRSGAKKSEEPDPEDNIAAKDSSSKRKRKSWTSLKEIAESNEHGIGSTRNAANFTIPFFM